MIEPFNVMEIKCYEALEPWNKMGFYLEVIEEERDCEKILNAWLCMGKFGIKEHALVLNCDQNDVTFSYDNALLFLLNYLFNGCYMVKSFIKQYCPEELEDYHSILNEYGIDEESAERKGRQFLASLVKSVKKSDD